uniref:Uncharacterized protein n=1 Tax=Panagrolaimus sp. ES5 TaxID=591445 RepID=A0AC34GCU0_9BILA
MKFSKLHQSECDVEYTVAVIKPIIDFFHSLSLQLPESYTHNYANEILNAFKFFKPVRKLDMKEKLHYSICNYFAKEKHTFDSILLWLSVACTHGIPDLREMICALIANEYYFKWQQKFPVTARNMENPLYRQLFKGRYVGTLFAAKVDRIYSNSFLTNLILQ